MWAVSSASVSYLTVPIKLVPVSKGGPSAEASPSSFDAVSAECEQGTEIPPRRSSTNAHFDGWFCPCRCWTGCREQWGMMAEIKQNLLHF